MPLRLELIALAVLLTTAAIYDWRTHRIPNRLTVTAMGLGLVAWFVVGCVEGGLATGGRLAGASMLGLLAGLLPMAAIMALGGFGGGDVKLMAAVGAWFAQVKLVLFTAFYSLLAAALLGLIIMVATGRTRATAQNLATAAMAAGAKAPQPVTGSDSPKIPFAVAVLVGAALASVEWILDIDLPWSKWTR